MQKNTAENSPAVEFRAKRHTPDRADPETAKKTFAQIRENLGDDADPMAVIWNDKISPVYKHRLWVMAGFPGADDGECHRQWRRITDLQKQKLKKVIAFYAGLSTRIKGALS